ncbi:glutamate--cysteine ligase [Pseudoalteromonas sp. McH1-7]|uniref:glutamate--cysteine ligase n=1 Tax=Pseudoalteromonas sp. McH1-7 TaxID=2745574 RepID=UPI0015910251|nr:glutamate--cysteine ligase [Pseudoalteromonas sp. McH1-7]NUZ12816.1 glutamate--cysteine ligase [Pseudoalteromonas sp. McH1-7]
MKQLDLNTKLDLLSGGVHRGAFKGIKRGIEREALRIQESGKIAKTPHPEKTGHALTNGHITTDFSESLLEFITPVSENPEETLAQLSDLQKFTLANMGDELLWPLSMPCFIEDEEDIVLAQFGTSNIGKMKTLYREGLKNRYGSMMQAIAGVHFNISFPEQVWQSLQSISEDKQAQQTFISQQYLGLIRNFKREMWLISYLFGASPALCPSFLQGKKSDLPFKTLENGAIYLEYGTALRLGDLGYTNSAQSSLKVMYNDLDEYIAGLREAIRCRSDLYHEIPDYRAAEPKQLNRNILQIENEFYSPIRPKRNAKSGETPTQALERGGIEYIEIRALDVNPFEHTGISLEQIHFLDVFLTYCLLKPSAELTFDAQKLAGKNLRQVVNQGRCTELELEREGVPVTVKQWGSEIFADLGRVARMLDSNSGKSVYVEVIEKLSRAIEAPALTFSGQLLSQLQNRTLEQGSMGLELANNYKQLHQDVEYGYYDEAELAAFAQQSFEDEEAVRAGDTVDFTSFLDDYFSRA